MRARGILSIAILGAWGGGMAIFVSREMRRSPLDGLAEAALRVAPGVTWLSGERDDGAVVGFSSLTVDTLPRQLLVTEYTVLQAPGVPAAERTIRQTVVHLSRALALRDFEYTVTVALDSQRLTGRALGDTLLSYAARGPGGSASGMLTHHGPLFVQPLLPLVATLRSTPRVGRSVTIELFDFDRSTQRTVDLVVSAESLFVIADSAAFDSASGRWRPAQYDSVQGWRLRGRDPADPDVWVDELGQVLARGTRGGVTWRRTAFELAFENWRLENPAGSADMGAGLPVASRGQARSRPGRRR